MLYDSILIENYKQKTIHIASYMQCQYFAFLLNLFFIILYYNKKHKMSINLIYVQKLIIDLFSTWLSKYLLPNKIYLGVHTLYKKFEGENLYFAPIDNQNIELCTKLLKDELWLEAWDKYLIFTQKLLSVNI